MPTSLPVLVLDNDPGLRDLLGLALDHGGVPVLTASSAEEAAALLRDRRPGLLLVDLNLGAGHCGARLARQWRRAGILVPFLVVTGTPNDPRVEELRTLPEFRGLLAKPFSVTGLVERVRSLLGDGKERQAGAQEAARGRKGRPGG